MWSPSKIVSWRQEQASLDAANTQEIAEKETRKRTRAENAALKRQKEADKKVMVEFRRIGKVALAFGIKNPKISRQPDKELLIQEGYIPYLPPPGLEEESSSDSSSSDDDSDSDLIPFTPAPVTRTGRQPRIPARFR